MDCCSLLNNFWDALPSGRHVNAFPTNRRGTPMRAQGEPRRVQDSLVSVHVITCLHTYFDLFVVPCLHHRPHILTSILHFIFVHHQRQACSTHFNLCSSFFLCSFTIGDHAPYPATPKLRHPPALPASAAGPDNHGIHQRCQL